MKTTVIFRKWRNGDVIAIFPYELGTNEPSTCMSYEHVGQHGDCSPLITANTSPASPAEYAPLYRELQGIRYDLRVLKRIPSNAYQTRYDAIRGITK